MNGREALTKVPSLNRAMSNYRLDSMMAPSNSTSSFDPGWNSESMIDVDQKSNEDSYYTRKPLEHFREQTSMRQAMERSYLKERCRELELELEKERKQRRSAETRISQLRAKLDDLESHRNKHVMNRLDVELDLENEKKARQAVADKKRTLEARFDRLLRAYQNLVSKYEELKTNYLYIKSLKQMTAIDRFKDNMKKVKELFTREQATDPDHLPAFSGNPEHATNLLTMPSASCDLCGDHGVCQGYTSSPINPDFCKCGHEKAQHDFLNQQPTAPELAGHRQAHILTKKK